MTVCVDESLRFLSELDGYTLLFLFLTFSIPFNHSTHLRMGLFISFSLYKHSITTSIKTKEMHKNPFS